jgi:hypothetical protein
MAAEAELNVDDLRALAHKLDATGQVDVDDSATETEDRESEDVESSTTEVEQTEPTQDELDKEEAEASDKDGAESSDTSEPKTKQQKDEQRFDRNWKKLEERRAEVERKEKEIAEREKQAAQAVKPKDLRDQMDTDGYSVRDYEFAAKKFKEDGDETLAAQAEQKGRTLYYHAFQNAWRSNMNEMIDQYPDLSDSRKPFTQACDKVLETLPFLKTIPDGCKYAVRIALGDTSDSLVSELKAENGKLKKEVERLNKSTRLSGSLPSKLPQGKTFDNMSDKERLDHLRDLAAAADREEL